MVAARVCAETEEEQSVAVGSHHITSVGGRKGLEQAIVDTVREPLIVLDGELRVLVASRSYYLAFKSEPQTTEGRMFYELSNGQWNIQPLRKLLEDIIPKHTTIEDYEVEHDLQSNGRRTMLLSARKRTELQRQRATKLVR